jgi:uncharacterized protein
MNNPTTKPVASQRKAFVETLKLARIGAREAQYEVALMYANGVGTRQDLAQAIEWVRKAAQRGLPAAQYLLASRYAHGVVVEKDERAALWWYQNAAEQGHVKAQYKWGRMVAQPQPEAALRSLRQAAEQGLPEAQYALAQALDTGEGCPVDGQAAVDWCLRAAHQGVAAAQCAMGDWHVDGRGVPRDTEAALGWYRLAARQNYPRAQLALERLSPSNGRRDKGRKRPNAAERRQSEGRWAQVAEGGDADARYCVGLMYAQGLGVEPDVARAQSFFLGAARLGHGQAQTALAALLESGDQVAARTWYDKAAHAGDPQAQHALGRLLHKSFDEALQVHSLGWHLQAARSGYAPAQLSAAQLLNGDLQSLRAGLLHAAASAGQVEAQFQWACCLAQGQGVGKDRARAACSHQMAAQAGHVEAAQGGRCCGGCQGCAALVAASRPCGFRQGAVESGRAVCQR